MEWLLNQPKEIIVAIISSISTFIIVVLTFVVKDYLLDRFKEKRIKKQSMQVVLESYSYPIIKACESLAWRLKEIFESRGAFLLEGKPRNEFFRYKYYSTLYRLCSVVVWLRAIEKEFNSLDLAKKKSYKTIKSAIFNLQSALADGQHIELSILREVSKYWNIDLSKMSNFEQAKLAIKIEDIVYSKLELRSELLSKNLSDGDQVELLKNIADTICAYLKCKNISDEFIKENKIKVITEISRVEAWIYRDWQNAIGDLFIKEISGSIRKYDVVGYGEFEKIYETQDQNKKWIIRIEKLFKNLNVEIDDRYDARINQLKRIYSHNLDLLNAFNGLLKKKNRISESVITTLRDFNNILTQIR